MYRKEHIRELQENSTIPVEIFDEEDINERKIKLFDILGTYQSQLFFCFTALPENDKVQMKSMKREQLFSSINSIYGIVPVSVDVLEETIKNELNG